MMRCIAVDDEKLVLDLLVDNISQVPYLHLVKACRNAMEAIEILQSEKIDLIFLDIQMPKLSGLQFIQTLQQPPMIILVTAYEKYALESYNLNVVDYLLKPVEPKRLADALQKLQLEEDKEPISDHTISINRSILNEHDQVFVKDGERCWFVKLSDIRLFESVGNYAKVYFGPNKPLILKSLNALEERLDEKVFFRANRKHIVNLRLIEKIEPYFNGGLLLEMKGGEKIEVSRRQTVKFKEMMSL